MLYRQGDILLKPISQFPSNIFKKKDLIIAYGEITGHTHQFTDPNLVSVYELNQQLFVEIEDTSELVHDEHNTLLIPQGKYEVIRQREVDLSEEIRKVMD